MNLYSTQSTASIIARRFFDPRLPLSEALRQTRIVYDAFVETVSNGRSSVRPGDVIELLRSRNLPMSIWYVLGQFSTLEYMKLIAFDEDSATWKQIKGITFDEAVAECESFDGTSMDASDV